MAAGAIGLRAGPGAGPSPLRARSLSDPGTIRDARKPLTRQVPGACLQPGTRLIPASGIGIRACPHPCGRYWAGDGLAHPPARPGPARVRPAERRDGRDRGVRRPHRVQLSPGDRCGFRRRALVHREHRRPGRARDHGRRASPSWPRPTACQLPGRDHHRARTGRSGSRKSERQQHWAYHDSGAASPSNPVPTSSSSAQHHITVGSDGALWLTEKASGNNIGRITTDGAASPSSPIPNGRKQSLGITAGTRRGALVHRRGGPTRLGASRPEGSFTEFVIPTAGKPRFPQTLPRRLRRALVYRDDMRARNWGASRPQGSNHRVRGPDARKRALLDHRRTRRGALVH